MLLGAKLEWKHGRKHLGNIEIVITSSCLGQILHNLLGQTNIQPSKIIRKKCDCTELYKLFYHHSLYNTV
jgi:hypothetical protein